MLSLNLLAAREHSRELRAAADVTRVDAGASPVTRVTLRYAAAKDAAGLRWLAELDSARGAVGTGARRRGRRPVAGGAAARRRRGDRGPIPSRHRADRTAAPAGAPAEGGLGAGRPDRAGRRPRRPRRAARSRRGTARSQTAPRRRRRAGRARPSARRARARRRPSRRPCTRRRPAAGRPGRSRRADPRTGPRRRRRARITEQRADRARVALQQLEQQPVLDEEAEQDAVGIADELLERAGAGPDRAQRGVRDLLRALIDDRPEHGLLVVEVVVERPRGEIGAPDHVAHAGGVVAELGEHDARGIDDRRPVLAPSSARVGRRRSARPPARSYAWSRPRRRRRAGRSAARSRPPERDARRPSSPCERRTGSCRSRPASCGAWTRRSA